MNTAVNIEIFVVKDNFGNICSAVTDDRSNDIQLCGLKNKKGEDLYYENDAWGFEAFCKKNGLIFKVVIKEIEVEI
jgi:hypothetical protein